VLFLDEPTAGLDPQSRIALWEILGELHVDGQTILLTTHYMEEADQLCDRVAIIDQGRIVALDTPAGLKRSVGADATVRVVAEGELVDLARLLQAEIEGATGVTIMGDAVVLGVQATEGVLPAVVQTAERNGFHVSDLSVSETSLETVFITLTGKDLRE
jgi:ABC-2 type transport system ATP-binding protein